MAYEHPKISNEQLESERNIKLKQLEEANANAQRTLEQSEVSAAARVSALRGETLYEVRQPDQIGE